MKLWHEEYFTFTLLCVAYSCINFSLFQEQF